MSSCDDGCGEDGESCHSALTDGKKCDGWCVERPESDMEAHRYAYIGRILRLNGDYIASVSAPI